MRNSTKNHLLISKEMEYINAALIRKHTCANSDVCDYLIVGDESKTAKEHPKKTDEQGYWYNVGT